MKNIDCLLIGYRNGDIDTTLNDRIRIDDEKDFNAAIAYLGTYIYRKGYSFEYINYIEDEYALLEDILSKNNFLVIGVSTTFCTDMESVKKIIECIKNIRADIPIVIGGVFIAKLINENINSNRIISHIFKLIGADYYINSFQGETTLTELIRTLKNNSLINLVPNIFYKEKNEFKYTATCPDETDLENNMVEWSLFSKRMRKIIPVRTAISCPFNCSFCSHKKNSGDYKYVSVEAIERELDSIQQIRPFETIHFVDDTFNVPQKRFKEILRLIINKEYKFNWYSYIRCQYIDDETAWLMKKSNCSHVMLGIESGSQKMLDIMNKQVTIKQLKEGITALNKYGIHTHGMFLLGFPGESDETVKETINFINEAALSSIGIGMWFFDKNSPINNQKEKYKITGQQYTWSHYSMNNDTAQKYIDKILALYQNKLSNNAMQNNIYIKKYNE